MLSALLVVWICLIPLAILGAAWANARSGRPAVRTAAIDSARWERITGLLDRSRTFDMAAFAPEPQPRATAAGHRTRRPTATLLAPRTDLRRACAAQQLRGRGDAGRTERF